MTSGGNNFNDFPENQLYQISCSLNSRAIPKMLCFVTIHWSQRWGPKVHGAPNLLIGGVCRLPTSHSCSAADAEKSRKTVLNSLCELLLSVNV